MHVKFKNSKTQYGYNYFATWFIKILNFVKGVVVLRISLSPKLQKAATKRKKTL